MASRLTACRLCGLASRTALWLPALGPRRSFAQSARPSRRAAARPSSRQPLPSSSTSSPSRSARASSTDEEQRENDSRPVRQPTPVSVNSLAASRRAAFAPHSQATAEEPTNLTPPENAAAILDILAALDRALPLRQLERLIHTLLALASAGQIPPLTPQQYLTALRALTRRPITVARHLQHYISLASRTPAASSPSHPAYNDARLMAQLDTEPKRVRMRRAFCLLAFGIRVDMAVQSLALAQADQALPVVVLQRAQRVLELAGHRYMAARVRKAVARAESGASAVRLPGESELSVDIRRAYPQLLASSEATLSMTAAQTQRLAAELERLSAGRLSVDEHLLLLLASVRIGQELTADEVESLSDMLPLASQKLELSRESAEDGIVRWQVMELTAHIAQHMRQQGTQPTQLIHDELFRVYANCAAIQPALSLLHSLRSTDSLHYRYLLRTASLLQRWERPHEHALRLLRSLPGHTQPDVSMYNDVLRACDRAEQHEQLFDTVSEMRRRGLDGNDVTHQYATSAGVQCGDEGRGVAEVVGRDEGSRAEWRRELEEEMAVVEQMGVADFVPRAEGGEAQSEEAESEEVAAEVQRVRERLKAELAEEMKLVDEGHALPDTANFSTQRAEGAPSSA